MSNSWNNGGGKQRKVCKCGCSKIHHTIRLTKTMKNEYTKCSKCSCTMFRAKAKEEIASVKISYSAKINNLITTETP